MKTGNFQVFKPRNQRFLGPENQQRFSRLQKSLNMVKRSKIDIVIDILNTITESKGRIKPTHLMYRSNLSHIQMKRYLSELLEKELVEEEEERKKKKRIRITKKGRDFLAEILRMKEFQKTFGL